MRNPSICCPPEPATLSCIRDGFRLTKAIREGEAPGTRLPIIAITANAMDGESQRCLGAGMDGYLSKPLRLQELALMLQKWLPVVDQPGPHGHDFGFETGPTAPVAPLWNSGTLGELAGDYPAMHRRLLEKFLANAREQVPAISEGIAASDFNEVETLAHIIKAAARSVSDLVSKGLEQPSGYTEPLLHAWRLKVKAAA